jgi:hypothetical protein
MIVERNIEFDDVSGLRSPSPLTGEEIRRAIVNHAAARGISPNGVYSGLYFEFTAEGAGISWVVTH